MNLLQPLGDDLTRAINVRAPLELDLDDGVADACRRAHVLHAIRAIERGLDRVSDLALDLFRGCAVGLDDHGHARRGEIGEDVYGHMNCVLVFLDKECQCCE